MGMATNWMPLVGNVEVRGDELTLKPHPTPPTEAEPAPSPFAVIRSNAEFVQGTIECEVALPTPKARFQFILAASGIETGAEIVYAGFNAGSAPYGFILRKNGVLQGLGGTGQGVTLKTAPHTYRLKLTVLGSGLDLYVDNVKVASTNHTVARGPVGLFTEAPTDVVVRHIKIDAIKPICFVVMQFSSEYDTLYTDVIRPCCEEYGYSVVRADDFYTSGPILEDITRSIRDASLIVADITPNNPNVFYEVGYAHALSKPTILLNDGGTREKLPFDISGFRTIYYSNSIGGKKRVDEALRKHLNAFKP